MARTNRVKPEGVAHYHVISRIANAEFLLADAEAKGRLMDFLRRAADFSGVDVLAYAVMDNHFHLCAATRPACEPDDAEVLRRVEVLYGRERRELLESLAPGSWRDAEFARRRARMGDLSELKKSFKQRVTQWFNARRGHVGTLWTGRFKSVLLEDGEHVRRVVDYIHANPVRAGIVEDAAGYAWSSLGAAARGDAFALRGLSLAGVDAESAAEGARLCRSGRDLRLSNAVVAGGRAFVERMAAKFCCCFRRTRPRTMAFAVGGLETRSTHGQRSAPAWAA